jgi:hypothetical protein
MMNRIRNLFRKPIPVIHDGSPSHEWLAKREMERRVSEASMFSPSTPYIYCPNEWDNISVGFVSRVEVSDKGTVTFLEDYVEGSPKESMIIGLPMFYTEQRLAALLKLDPFQRWAVCTGFNWPHEIDKDKTGSPMAGVETRKALKTNGFYSRLKMLDTISE